MSADIEAQSCSTHLGLFGKKREDEADFVDDFNAVFEYFRNTAYKFYSNEGRIAPDNFSDPVSRFSSIRKRKIDETSAHWYDKFV